MADRFDVPPEGRKIRSLVEQRLAAALNEHGARVTVEWRGEQRHLHVVSMPVEMLYYNPDTHRIRAQRTLDPERNRVLDEDPWGEAAQTYLHDLLRRSPANPAQTDPDYVQLMDELDDFGQRDPGVISRDGILVDGNTRCAALRDLGIKDIRVGVLPEDTSRRDINNVELSVQLRRDKRREYSYINRLIAIEEEISNGRREEDVARDFNIKRKTLQHDRRTFKMINEAIERSRSYDGTSLRLIDFEDHQEKLRELQRDVSKLAETDKDAARQLMESRLSMVILNYPKTTVRVAEADFHQRYLKDRLPPELRSQAKESESVAIPGLSGVKVTEGTADSSASRSLTDQLLKARAQKINGEIAGRSTPQADSILSNARKVFDTATKLAGADNELKKRKIAVPERLTDAAEDVNQCAREFTESKEKRALDEEAFDDALLTLRASLAQLARHAGRSFPSPGDGVAWLLDATRE